MNLKHVALAVVLGAVSFSTFATTMYPTHQQRQCGGGHQQDEPDCNADWSDSWSGSVYLSERRTSEWDYTFDITNDGFVVGEDQVNFYSLSFSFLDGDRSSEWVSLFQDGIFTQNWEVDLGTIGLTGTAQGRSALNEFGQLTVSLDVTDGDFWLTGASLIACGYEVFDAFRLGYGWPDLYVRSKCGAWAWIEVKMPGEGMTEAERRWWDRYNGPGLIAYSLEQALEWLHKMDEMLG